jgi:hypothetical protein
MLGAVSAGTNKFLASFADAGNGMEDSFFQMSVDGGSASYEYKLDLSGLDTTCDLSQGLTYHFHTYWTDDAAKASTSTCGDAGGHFDPFLACGPSSQDSAGLCPMLNRTADQGYTYPCTADRYASGHHAECEVGDISGKFGRMMPTVAGEKLFVGVASDPNPPIQSNFFMGDGVAKQWASLVVHCPEDNARLVCAEFFQEKC